MSSGVGDVAASGASPLPGTSKSRGVAPRTEVDSGASDVAASGASPIPGTSTSHGVALRTTVAASAGNVAASNTDVVQALRNSVTRRTPISQLKVMNYFPALNGWYDMWLHWDPVTIDSDFARIASLHANTVRIVVDTYTWSFGWPAPNPVMLTRLSTMVSLAARRGLGVQLTLFDQFTDFGNFSDSESWAKQVVAPFYGDTRINFIELRNEMNPNVPEQNAWVKHMTPFVKSIAGGIPIAVSVCGCDNAGDLAQLKNAIAPVVPDLWDFHFYADAALAFGVFRDAKAIAAPQPVLIGETGYRTDVSNSDVAGIPWTQSAQEAYQDQFYRTVANAARQAGIPPVAPWILYDIADPNCAPTCTQTYGIFRANGSAKPAVNSVIAMFTGAPISTDLNNSFERGSLGYSDIWRLYGWGKATFAQDSTVAHSGTSSARISSSSTVLTGGDPSFYSVPVDGAVVGRTYSMSSWVAGTGVTGNTYVGIGFFDAHGAWLGGVFSSPLPAGNSGWTLLTASGTAPAGTTFRELILASGNNGGTAWFDDVTFS